MPLFVVVLLKRTIYNKEKKREAENERRENERSQSGHNKALKARFHYERGKEHSFSLLLIFD